MIGDVTDDRFGSSLDLDSDGAIVAISAPNHDENCSNEGHAKIFQNNGGTWTQLGDDINGVGNGFITSVDNISLSSDGTILAVAPWNDIKLYKFLNNKWNNLYEDISITGSSPNNDPHLLLVCLMMEILWQLVILKIQMAQSFV